MNVVIQCAAGKSPNSGYFQIDSQRKVCFVAQPDSAPPVAGVTYARPDDSVLGKSYRQYLLEYNQTGQNPWKLLPAWQLYQNAAYSKLVERVGLKNLFILSAGWGLISAEFLTPYYDITFSNAAEKYKKRSKKDSYADFNMLPRATHDDLVFFGAKDYLPLFKALSSKYLGRKFVFFNSKIAPELPGCRMIKFETRTRTNWHYECVNSFVNGTIHLLN